jgi:hypothetical protein
MAMHRAPKAVPGVPVMNIGITSEQVPSSRSEDEWNGHRDKIYSHHRGLFLTHVLSPSSDPGQLFDVFIYLIRHKSEDLSDIVQAEFFLGRYWRNTIFTVVPEDGFVGISTSAYGTFLCVCRLTFSDGESIYLDRYVDFETQRTGGAGT